MGHAAIQNGLLLMAFKTRRKSKTASMQVKRNQLLRNGLLLFEPQQPVIL